MKFKEDIDVVRKRIYGFLNGEMQERALIAVRAPKKTADNIDMHHNERDLTKNPSELLKYWTDPETIHKVNVKRMENTYFGGESLPSIFLNFGTSGHCNYMGAKPTYGNQTIWFNPVWDDLSECENAFNMDALSKHIEITKELVKLSNGDYFIGLPDSCGTLDALGHLYGSENVLMDMITDPDAVKKAIEVVNEAWKISEQMFYDVLKDLNQGSMHSWMHLLAPGKMGQMQCDMSVMFSKDAYQEFVYDELKTQVDWFDYPIYHFDGVEQERHLDIILGFDKLKAIQWTNVAGQPPASHFMPILQRIQKAGKGLIVFVDNEEIPVMLENLSSKGLYLLATAKNEEDAKDLVKFVEKNSRK